VLINSFHVVNENLPAVHLFLVIVVSSCRQISLLIVHDNNDNLRVRGHPYNLPECSTNVHKNHLLCVVLYKIYRFYNFFHHYICFVLFYCVFCFICIASHCYVMSLLCLCAFVTLNKRLLTCLLNVGFAHN